MLAKWLQSQLAVHFQGRMVGASAPEAFGVWLDRSVTTLKVYVSRRFLVLYDTASELENGDRLSVTRHEVIMESARTAHRL